MQSLRSSSWGPRHVAALVPAGRRNMNMRLRGGGLAEGYGAAAPKSFARRDLLIDMQAKAQER